MCVDSITDCFHAAVMGTTSYNTVKSQTRGFKGMPPEIALNRWLTCGWMVSATRKITVRCRWRCPRCRSILMFAFLVIIPLPFMGSSRVTLCALVLSIPAPRDWGPCCALWRWWWCPPSSPPPPPPPSLCPSVRPALLLSGLKP